MLPREARMQRSSEFAQLRQRGRRIPSGCLVMNWGGLPVGAHSKLGVVTGRKVGGAVDRSRARRLLREVYRLHQHEMRGPVAMVLVARPSIQDKNRSAVERDFLVAVRGAGLWRGASGLSRGSST